MLCCLGAWAVCVYVMIWLDADDSALRRGVMGVVILISGLGGLAMGAMAVILFVKWVWYS